jgi:endonuclease/exonuclease/phosphatase family metal-dependent hydrolase
MYFWAVLPRKISSGAPGKRDVHGIVMDYPGKHNGLRLLITLALCVLLDTFSPILQAEQGHPTVHVATYNINFANRSPSHVVDAIRDSGADIVVLQETTPDSETYLQAKLGSEYPHTIFHGHGSRYYAERFGFLCSYPIADTVFLEPEFGLFGTLIGRFDVGHVRIQVANVHLDPVDLFSDRTILGILRALRKAETNHLREVRRILDNLDGNVPTIIAGDFNGTSGSPANRQLVETGFTDSFAAVTENPDDHPTWMWRTRVGKLAYRLDYIYHDDFFETTNSRIICNNSSDHFLVVSTLNLPAPRVSDESASSAHAALPDMAVLVTGSAVGIAGLLLVIVMRLLRT